LIFHPAVSTLLSLPSHDRHHHHHHHHHHMSSDAFVGAQAGAALAEGAPADEAMEQADEGATAMEVDEVRSTAEPDDTTETPPVRQIVACMDSLPLVSIHMHLLRMPPPSLSHCSLDTAACTSL
jgi:hypothetical protein